MRGCKNCWEKQNLILWVSYVIFAFSDGSDVASWYYSYLAVL